MSDEHDYFLNLSAYKYNVSKLSYGPLTLNIKMCASNHKITQYS